MKRNKSVFPTLLFIVISCLILSLGCGDSVHTEICKSDCSKIGAEFYRAETDFINWNQTHYCICRFNLPTFTVQDAPSSKQDAPQKTDNPPIGATMVQQ